MVTPLGIKTLLPILAGAALSAFALWQHFSLPLWALAFLFALCAALFIYCAVRGQRRTRLVALFPGLFFALSFILAKLDIASGEPGYPAFMLLRFIGLFLFFSAALCAAYSFLSDKSLSIADASSRNTSRRRLFLVFAAAFVTIFLWFVLWFLYRYPGYMTLDFSWQLLQARKLDTLSNHHPIIHTMILRLCLQACSTVGLGLTQALAFYTLLQAAVLAASFAWLLTNMYKFGVKRWFIVCIYLSFFLLPYHGVYSVIMVKDTWFGAIVLALCVTLWRLMQHEGRLPLWDVLLLYVLAASMCLFRTNGLYAFFLLLPFIALLFFKKNKAAVLAAVLALATALFVKGPVFDRMGVMPPDTIESLSVPTQTIARAVIEGAELNPEQEELLSKIVDISSIPATYYDWVSDPMKALIRYSGDQAYLVEHKGDFLRLWIELGLENPGSYLRGYVDLSSGYWYPRTDGEVINEFFSESSDPDIICLLPDGIAAILQGICRLLPTLPVINLFFSNGAALWLYLALFGLCLVKGRYRELVLYIPALAVWGTLLIASPLNNEFRYVYALYTTLPLMLLLPFYEVNYNKASKPQL